MKSLKVYARFISMKTAKSTEKLKDYGQMFVDVIILGSFYVLAISVVWIIASTIVLLLLPIVLFYLLFIYPPFKPRKKNNTKKIWIKFFLKRIMLLHSSFFIYHKISFNSS